MVFNTVCIGINKYSDRRIPELAGATRDAQAVWSIFKDNIVSSQDNLLVNDQATYGATFQLLQKTFEVASSEDVILIFFAGHGDQSHRLVLHDTIATGEELSRTSIGMQDLAQMLASTKAKAAVVLLDCCFSGGAAARVIHVGPIARTLSSSDLVSGDGRLLIAASSPLEYAYEDAASGHGLFTKALIAELFNLKQATDVLAFAGRVQSRTRADAERMGIHQNPEIVGHVSGGLSLGPFIRGSEYDRLFPDLRALQTDRSVQSLQAFGFPETLTDVWKAQFLNGLNDLQLTAINEHHVLDKQSLLVVAPTSSGKTFIGEIAAAKAALEGRKAVFLFPYKALTNEKFDEFTRTYGNTAGLRIIRCTGDHSDTVEEFVQGKYDMALLTFEMFLNLIVSSAKVLNSVSLVVIDEAQFISDPNRGINVELLLTFLLNARQRGISPQILLLSAVIGGINDFDAWLELDTLRRDIRPVPLHEGVIDRNGTYKYKSTAGGESVEQLLEPFEVIQRRDKPSSQDIIVPLVAKLLREDATAKVLIFRNTKGSAMGCAAYLAKDLSLPAAEEALTALPEFDLSNASARLRDSFSGGTAFHTADLTREEKSIVENAFRSPTSLVRVLAATTGVAAGINTPASAVILAETDFKGEDGREFTIAEVKNMAGRAGRLGFQEQGVSIILSDHVYQRNQLYDRYVLGTLESFKSSFQEGDIGTWLIKLLAHVDVLPRADIPNLLVNTYGGYLRARRDPMWTANIWSRLDSLISRMATLGLLKEENQDVHLTLLGVAVGRSSLSLESALELINLLSSLDAALLTPENLLVFIQVLPELDDTYIPFRKGKSERLRAQQAGQRFGDRVVQELQRGTGDMDVYLARCKRAALLFDWIQGDSTEAIEKTYSINAFSAVGRGNIQGLADVTRYHLRSAADMLLVIAPSNAVSQEELEKVFGRLEFGLPVDALSLLQLPIRLERGILLTFYQAGIRSIKDIDALGIKGLTDLIGKKLAEKVFNGTRS